MQVLKALGVVMCILVITVLAYIGYRYWGVHRVQQLTFQDDYSGIPPVQCVGSGTTFFKYGSVQTVFANGAIRSDTITYDRSALYHVHLLVTPTKAVYLWDDEGTTHSMFQMVGKSKSVSSTDLTDMGIDVPMNTSYNCSPWWSVDEDKFVVPSGVRFTDLAAQ